jgi:hypothetical protein
MRSRYDFMDASVVRDTEDNSVYPDPLTLNYNTFKLGNKPRMLELTSSDVDSIWMLIAQHYGTAEYDDMVLTLNGVPHRNLLTEGSILFIPDIKDIETSFRKTGE